MAAIADFAKYSRLFEDTLGLRSVRDALVGPSAAFLAQEERRQRDLASITAGMSAADLGSSIRTLDLGSSVSAFRDGAYARSQVEIISEVARMAVQSPLVTNLAETLAANDVRRWEEVVKASHYNAADVGGAFCADDFLQKFGAADIARASFAESVALAQNQALQNKVQLAMPDTTAFRQALLTNIPTGIEAILASVRDISTVFKSSIDPFAAYGPFVHSRSEPPSWDFWRDRGRNDSWDEPDYRDGNDEEIYDDYEQTESGLYVPKSGRPPGPSILTKGKFLESFQICAQMTGQPPTMEGFSEFMELHFEIGISVSTIQRYCRTWKLRWRDLRAHIANC